MNKTRSTQAYALPERSERADYIRRNFDAIAANYDRFNDWITFGAHRLWKRRAIALTGLRPGPVALLDLCCGSGDLSLLAARRLGPAARITALDFSEGMLAILRDRMAGWNAAQREKFGQITTQSGDATDLSAFADGSFDAITISFGLRNVQDRERCLAECRRTLKPGARLVILDVGQVKSAFVAFFHRFYFERIVPRIGFLTHRSKHEMYEYLPASAKIYPDQESLKGELLQAGFTSVFYRNVMLGAAVIHVAVK